MKKGFFIAAFMFAYIGFLKAQPVYNYLKSADEYYKAGNYFSAITYYEKYLTLNADVKTDAYNPYTTTSLSKEKKVAVSNKQQAIYKLAESYRLLNFPSKAEGYYKQATAFDKQTYPLATYWYGKTLRALGKYADADSTINNFVNNYTIEDNYKEDAVREISNIKFIQQQATKKDLNLYTVNKANTVLNAKGSNCAPMWVNKNTLMFTSTRLDSTAPKNKQYVNKIYFANYSDGVVNNVQKSNIAQPENVHQGITTITPDGNTIFFSRWSIAHNQKSSTIYTAKKNADGSWATPSMLDSSFNLIGTNNKEPFVMPNGKQLVFSSNRNGGLGGFDLWYVDLDDNGNVLGTPNNMGNVINTKFDEVAPFYHAASNSLVYSSNGNIGMGGFDFFQSKGTIGNWAAPINMGYPLNSIKDDIYFVSNGPAKNILADVMFSSDRNSDCCLDIFTLSKQRLPKNIFGTVVDCETKAPLAGVKVEIVDAANKIIETQTSNTDGTYTFKLEDFMALTINGTMEGYNAGTVKATTPSNDEDETQNLPELCLQKPAPPPPPKVDTVIVMDNIYFDFNSAKIKSESNSNIDLQVLSLLTQYPTMQLEISGHTDALGDDEYNLKLSQRRAEAVKEYLISKGIVADRLTTVGYGELKPVAPNKTDDGKDNPEGRAKNRRIEFRVVGYK